MTTSPRFLEGRTALVTGSTRRGIGATTAIVLAHHGANVVLNFGTGMGGAEVSARAATLGAEIEAQTGSRILVVEASIREEADVQRMFAEARAHFGAVDILVNSAGGLWLEQDFASITTEHWEQAFRSEVDGTFYCIREALPEMRSRHWGRIINVGIDPDALELLINAHYGHVLERYPFDFHLAKTAKSEITHKISMMELKHNITVNNLLPGIIENMDNDEVFAALADEAQPAAWFGPLDVANSISFLCSEAARGITRSDIRLPGNIYKRL